MAWGKSGEACKKFLVKGQIAAVEGKIKYSNYEKDGKKVYAIDIVSFGRRKEQKEAAGDDIPWTW